MIWLIIGFVVFLFVTYDMWSEALPAPHDMSDIGFGLFWSAILLLIAFMVSGLIAMIVGSLVYPDSEIYTETRTDIVLMKDENSPSGSWSLFGGSIDSEPSFSYYSNDNGVKRLESIEADDVLIIEDSPEPYMLERDYTSELRFWGSTYAPSTVTEFHIPEGSIKQTVVLDGE